MSLYKPNITKTSPADRKKLERASALALPTNPTARGMTADQIKAALWTPIFGSDVSLLKELDRVVDAVNSYLMHLYTFLENGVPGTGAGGSDTESVKVHNTDPASHADIRDMIQKVSDHLQAIANSDDITLDQLSEIVAFIKDNKTLIERITTEKVNVTDIIDNVETNLSNKPLSAKQGVVLQKQITDLEKEKLNASELDPAIADALLRANEAIAQHNTDKLAHREVFGVLEDLQRRVAGLLDTDDTTLDQLSEIITFIKNNKSLIDNITTSKVNVSDIIDNLITSATSKPLSANQGVVLKRLIDQLATEKLNASALEPAIAQVLVDAQAQVNAHNTSEESHADLRLLISDYYADVKSLLDTDDKTLDQTSEIVGYIKDNRGFIDAITTSKVNVLDIVDNLTTNASDKPLSAAMGVKLKDWVNYLLNNTILRSEIVDNLESTSGTKPLSAASGKVLMDFVNRLFDEKLDKTELDPELETILDEVESKIEEHNTDKLAHREVFGVLEDLQRRVAGLLDTDDTTLDQLSEIITYIKNNKSLIDNITTSKVNVSDIIDNLTTSATNKPLSANQGMVLKGLIDMLSTKKLDASSLDTAISQALSEAKESGAFDGKDGDPGKTPVKGTDYFTQQDIQDMVQAVKDALPSEKWDFELEDGTVVTKGVYVDA